MHPSAVAGNFWFLENLGRVAISMVSARDGSACALVLDAKMFQEDARAKFPYAMPYGFHSFTTDGCPGTRTPS